MRWAALLFLGCWAWGCQDTIELEAPPTEGARAQILVLESSGQVQAAYAYNLAGPVEYPSIAYQPGQLTQLYLANYSVSLDELGIAAGSIDFSNESAPSAPTPASSYQLEPGGAGWALVDPEPPTWSRLHVPRLPRVCATWGQPTVTSTVIERSTGRGGWLAGDRSGTLLGNSAGVWALRNDNRDFEVVLDSTLTATLGLSLTATGAFLAGYLATDGRGFLYTRAGGLYVRELGGWQSLEAAPGATGGADYAWMAGPDLMDSTRFEFALLDSEGGLWIYDSGGWLSVLPPDPSHPIGADGALIWISPGTWLVAGPQGGRLLRARAGGVSPEEVSGLERPTALSRVYGQGVFVGDANGRLWRSEAGTWGPLEAPPNGPVRLIHFLRSGIVYGGQDGILTYFSDADLGCHASLDLGGPIIGIAGSNGQFRRNGYSAITTRGDLRAEAPLYFTRINF